VEVKSLGSMNPDRVCDARPAFITLSQAGGAEISNIFG